MRAAKKFPRDDSDSNFFEYSSEFICCTCTLPLAIQQYVSIENIFITVKIQCSSDKVTPMKLRKFLASIFAMFLIFTAEASLAQQFQIDRFSVDVFWKVQGNKLSVSGYVEDGTVCRQVNFDIYLKNREMDGISHINTSTVERHEPGERTYFEGRDTVGTKMHRKDWYIDDIFLNCLE